MTGATTANTSNSSPTRSGTASARTVHARSAYRCTSFRRFVYTRHDATGCGPWLRTRMRATTGVGLTKTPDELNDPCTCPMSTTLSLSASTSNGSVSRHAAKTSTLFAVGTGEADEVPVRPTSRADRTDARSSITTDRSDGLTSWSHSVLPPLLVPAAISTCLPTVGESCGDADHPSSADDEAEGSVDAPRLRPRPGGDDEATSATSPNNRQLHRESTLRASHTSHST
mmetsp:Transcript_15379/g.48039  ORF Transcript_15379/g.48039 Transcript_15379/m.48039 type:complete len:228 (-) Transcript_15379:457-1140(-)